MYYQQTRIYQTALELNRLTKEIIEHLPRGMYFLADQLRRAASSIVLNFAEGYAKPSQKDQRRFYAIAKGSTYEVGAILDVMKEWDAISIEHYESCHHLVIHLAGMLTKFRR